MACCTSVFPPARCSTFAIREFIRVPCPAARITTVASLSIAFQFLKPPFPSLFRELDRNIRDRLWIMPHFGTLLHQVGFQHRDTHSLDFGDIVFDRKRALSRVSTAQ